MSKWSVYLLRCCDDSLYCGVTKNVRRRVQQHNAGKGARYTRGRIPVYLAASHGRLSKKEAYQLEYLIKQLPKIKKIPFVESLY